MEVSNVQVAGQAASQAVRNVKRKIAHGTLKVRRKTDFKYPGFEQLPEMKAKKTDLQNIGSDLIINFTDEREKTQEDPTPREENPRTKETGISNRRNFNSRLTVNDLREIAKLHVISSSRNKSVPRGPAISVILNQVIDKKHTELPKLHGKQTSVSMNTTRYKQFKRKNWKASTMNHISPERLEPKIVDYLAKRRAFRERRTEHKGNADLQEELNAIPKDYTQIGKMKNLSLKIENRARIQENRIEEINIRNPEYLSKSSELSDMLIKSIRTKLALIDVLQR